jgi:hypothetical protein
MEINMQTPEDWPEPPEQTPVPIVPVVVPVETPATADRPEPTESINPRIVPEE